ncbi:hypothetical protein [Cellulomonas endometrii]|uniref:hypothetical protein n=1 Tax=Cellulomonas endometrii TaxID=3036301 RepID=UPI0024AD3827|nr:hypothetical protein [Cellulomonas endometrii]
MCTLAASRDGVVLKTEVDAVPDATSTSCGQIELQDPRLTSGTWDVRVTYTSPATEGTSPLSRVEIP